MDFTEETATSAVLDSLAGTPDARTRTVVDALVRHLHAFVREIEPSIDEWTTGVAFLTAVGHRSDETRQEFVLLSDVLGVSMLVEAIAARRASGSGEAVAAATPSTVLGPFHVVESPPLPLGADIDLVGGHQPCVLTGQVVTIDGAPVAGATVDVWQADADGFYDVQQPETQPRTNGRGLFTTDDDGRFWVRTHVPSYYPIPTDGPVGDLLRATARHPYRPAHIHFIVQADGFVPLTTHLFVADSPYIDSDAVFAVNQRLVQPFPFVHDDLRARSFGVTNPFRHAHAELVLRPQDPPSPRSSPEKQRRASGDQAR
jgi:hydroxyquinol 1,2-dioxygenase